MQKNSVCHSLQVLLGRFSEELGKSEVPQRHGLAPREFHNKYRS
jgi:hypothetical protein